MANLYITVQNAWIKKTGDRLVVGRGGAVLIYGNVQFSTQARSAEKGELYTSFRLPC